MASVYLARQIDLDRQVALKMLDAFRLDEPAFATRFVREAQLAGSLSHPNIVTVHDYFVDGETPYIAMELLERGSLRPYLGRMTLAQVGAVLEGIMAGLTHAERQRVVHRDLKPENVLVTSDGLVKIADFGIAKATSTVRASQILTQTGMTVGTPAYMAPEQGLAQEVGPWTDLYALGCIAYELFVGAVPYSHPETPLGLLMRKVSEPPIPAVQVDPSMDIRVSDWIGRLLEREPSERPASARDAWLELEDLMLEMLGPTWRRDSPLPDLSGGGEPNAGPHTPPPSGLPSGPLMPTYESYVKPPPVRRPEESVVEMWRVEAALDAVMHPPVEQGPGEVSPASEPAVPNEVAVLAETPPPAELAAPADTRPPAELAAPAETPPPAETPETLSEAFAATLPPRHVPRVPAAAKRRRGRLVAVVLGVAALAALVVIVALRGGGDTPAPRTATATATATRAQPGPGPVLTVGSVRLRAPDGFTAANPIPGLGLDRATAAASPGGEALTIGMAGAVAYVPGLLAPELAGTADDPRPARLGTLDAYRYDGVRGTLTLVVAPTTAGVLTLACTTAAACETAAKATVTSSLTGYPVGPSKTYAALVDRSLAAFVSARDRAHSGLASAHTARGQAGPAKRAAVAQARVAEQFDAAKGISPEDAWSRSELALLTRESSRGFARLATAARWVRRADYDAAAQRITKAERGLTAALTELSGKGYRDLLTERFTRRSIPAFKAAPKPRKQTAVAVSPASPSPSAPSVSKPQTQTRTQTQPSTSSKPPAKKRTSTEPFGGIEG